MRFLAKIALALAVLTALLLLAAACTRTPAPAGPGSPGVSVSSSSGPAASAPAAPTAPRQGDPALAAPAAYGIPLQSLAASGPQTGIWVSGTGKVTIQPDLAALTIGVEARAATVEEARGKASDAMNSILASLKANDIQDRDIRTRFFDVSPQYTWRQPKGEPGQPAQQSLIGYQVTNQATVRVRKMDAIGKVVDDVTKAGGDLTRIHGISFTVEDPTPFYTQAREQAVKDSLAKARQFASLTGVTLGKLVYINESASAPVAREFEAKAALAAPAPGAPTPISGGEMEIQVSVQAAFAIQ